MTKEELFSFVKENPTYCRESYFSSKFPYFYDDIKLYNFPNDFKFSQKLYHYFNNDFNLKLGLCPVCGKRCKFTKFGKGYYSHCSVNCINKDKKCIEKTMKTNFEKYGVKYYSQTKEYKDKCKQTCLEKYGVKCFSKSKDYSIKYKQTCLEKYGVDSYSKTEEYKDKSKQTCLEKYGVDSYSKTEEHKIKFKQTCLKKYGVDNYCKSNIFKERNIKKYGVDNYSKTEESKEKSKQTNLEKFGVEYYTQSKECIDKIKSTCLEKYGVEYFSQSCNYKKLHDSIQYKRNKTFRKNNSFHISKIERELTNWFTDNKFNFIRQYKSESYPFACDFYLVDYDLYIEIQGSWTHGFHPFDENSQEDINKLNLWKSKNSKYYDNAINVWTIRDVKKRNIAKENKLNYLEIFSINLDECIFLLKNKINNQNI